VHKGCVNSIVWNQAGDKILSASDDQKLVISNPFTSEIYLKYTTVHRSNIFSAKFLPQSSSKVVSCAGNGSVLFTDLDEVPMSVEPGGGSTIVGGSYRASNENLSFFNCHNGKTAYEVITLPTEPNSFMSCGEDGTVRFVDLRTVSRCTVEQCRENILVYSPVAVTSMSLSPVSNTYLAVGCADFVRIYDRRYMKLVELPTLETTNPTPPTLSSYGADYHTKALKLFKIPTEEKRSYRVTSLVYSQDEKELLVSFSSEYLYLFDITHDGVSADGTNLEKGRRRRRESPKVLRKLRLRGDWSDTGPEARPLSEVSAQSRPQLNSGLMNRMTGLLSRMLNDPRQRQNHRTDENVAEGISILFGNNEHGLEPLSNDEPSTSAAASSSTESEEAQRIVDSSSSSSEDDSVSRAPNYDYVKQKFLGHRNCRTMIKEANFWGDDFVNNRR
jgi:DDB1- and CUL4-associated factor 6